eukprot:3073493-Heterocapsa_arctica.AAC.1
MIPRLRKTTSIQRRCGDWQAMTCSSAVVSEALVRNCCRPKEACTLFSRRGSPSSWSSSSPGGACGATRP